MRGNVALTLALASMLSGCSLFEEDPCKSSEAKEFLGKEIRRYDILEYGSNSGQIKLENDIKIEDEKIISELKINAKEIVDLHHKNLDADKKCNAAKLNSILSFATMFNPGALDEFKKNVCLGDFGAAYNYISRLMPEARMLMRSSGFSDAEIARELPKTWAPGSYEIYNNEIKKYVNSLEISILNYRKKKNDLNNQLLIKKKDFIDKLQIDFVEFYEFINENDSMKLCSADLVFYDDYKKINIKIKSRYTANKFGNTFNYKLDFLSRIDGEKAHIRNINSVLSNHSVNNAIFESDSYGLFEEADIIDQMEQDYGRDAYFFGTDSD